MIFMVPIICRPVSEIDFEAFTAAFNHAYSDYFTPVVMSAESFRHLMARDDLSLVASVAALDNGAVVGTGLLGIRGQTGWIGGMGVIPERRRQGIGRQMMLYLIDRARKNGLTKVGLEVIEANQGAYELYRQLGFEPVRYLLILERAPVSARPDTTSPYQVVENPIGELLRHYDAFHDVPNCWQRARPSLDRLFPHIEGWAALSHEQIVGYALGWATQFDVRLIDLAATPHANRITIAQTLLTYLHQQNPYAYGAIYNIAEDDTLLPAYEALEYNTSFRQIEMRLTLEDSTQDR
jgi:ribosomal protein S18 acetylase RimI-like enzyme